MADLSTTYLGLKLRNPVIVASCGFTSKAESVLKCEEAGAGAVVLKSIFEEQISQEVEQVKSASFGSMWHPEAAEYVSTYGRENAVEHYLAFIGEAKRAVSIPVIASVHCVTAGVWTEFAKRIEAAGADAIELNLFVMPSDPTRKSEEIEQVYFDVVAKIKEVVSIPVSLKLGYYFSSLASMLVRLGKTGLEGMVLFNRFRAPDFDVEEQKVVAAKITSQPEEYTKSLRWISIMSDKLDCDLSATTGVHTGKTVVKQLLAGASSVQVCSVLYDQGLSAIGEMTDYVQNWMRRHNYESIEQFKGNLSRSHSGDPADFDRVQFMKTSFSI